MEIPREFYKKRINELVRYTSADTYDGMVFLTFMRGQKQITIQFKREEFESLNVLIMIQEIQNYFYAVDWSDRGENWCYMNRSRKHKFLRFIQRHKEVDRYKIKEQPWARLVHERDISFDEYGPLDFRFGKWKGREVDVYKVWMDRDMHFLDRAMKAYRRLQDTNLTYDVLGHVIDDDGNIVGIMTEPMEGRHLELHDEALVLRSLHVLNEMGWILDTPSAGSMLVTDKGELRITAMHNVMELPKDPTEREQRIKNREAFCSERVFGVLKKESPSRRIGLMTRAKLCVPVQILVPQADPEKILKGSSDWIVEPFKDRFLTEPVEILRMTRPGGIKRLLEADGSDEERETGLGDGRKSRPTKKHRHLFHGRQNRPPRSLGIQLHEAPLPCLPVPEEDLPLMPPSLTDISRSALPCVPSPASPHASSVPGWIRDGPWLELATTSRFEIIDP